MGSVFLFSQCKKDPTKAEIRIVELTPTITTTATGLTAAEEALLIAAGIPLPVSTSEVKLFVDSSALTGFFLCNEGFVNEKDYSTNTNSVISECFDSPALLNVLVVSTIPVDGGTFITKTGTGKLNLIEHETTAITIKVN